MKQYLDLLNKVMTEGVDGDDRTGTGTRSIFGTQTRYDLREGFPLLTTKKMAWANTIRELLWFIKGSENLKDLHHKTHPWWLPWADENGDLGAIYGTQLRKSRYYTFTEPKRFTPPIPPQGSVFGVGSLDNDKATHCNDELDDLLKNTWRDMLRRCYNINAKSYKHYGAKGVHVCSEWFSYRNFKKDFKKIPGWELKLEFPDEYTLDKDIRYASNRYSVETCMWASKEEQSMNTSTNTPFSCVSPDGYTYDFSSLGELSREAGLNLSAIHRCLKGQLHTHKGWSNFKYLNSKGSVVRYRCTDQLKSVIASLKHNPLSRRHMINLWHTPAMISDVRLPCCHGSIIQFYVRNGELSCQMYQRSADLFIGVPVNIASYSLLTHMVANVIGLAPGDFIHTIGDAHIYHNHFDQVKEQLKRDPKSLPTLSLNPLISDIDDFEYEHIGLLNYHSHPAIKAEVAV